MAIALQSGRGREVTMLHIRVQYDAYTRTFKLVDHEFRTILEGDALYDLAIPLTAEEAEVADQLTATTNNPVAHA
jgi:hypothetical protein